MNENFAIYAQLHLDHRLSGVDHQSGCPICEPEKFGK